MHNLIGKPAEGEDFFDRERELRQVWDRLETDNVLLLAARRVGKTSLSTGFATGPSRRGSTRPTIFRCRIRSRRISGSAPGG